MLHSAHFICPRFGPSIRSPRFSTWYRRVKGAVKIMQEKFCVFIQSKTHFAHVNVQASFPFQKRESFDCLRKKPAAFLC